MLSRKKASVGVIPIKPLDASVCSCPRCKVPFESGALAITGMHNLVGTTCGICGRSYLVELPVGHALFLPLAVDISTLEIFGSVNADWFSRPLVESINAKIVEKVSLKIHRTHKHSKIVLVNCLDYLFGHCLLKLLNVQHYLDNHSDLACCVMVPKQFVHLVPESVAEIWEVDIPLKAMQQWHTSLQQQIDLEISSRELCYLSVAHSHPHPSRYNLDLFVPSDNAQETRLSPTVVYCYREDRLWGIHKKHQVFNINYLYRRLVLAYPSVRLVVTGFGKYGGLNNGIVDERVVSSSLSQERKWLRIYANADCVIGVHGSNMLLPSGLARHVVELLPEDRLGNITQDLLWSAPPVAAHDALYRARIVPGRSSLIDVRPSLIASIVIHQLAGAEAYAALTGTSTRPIEDAHGIFDTDAVVTTAPQKFDEYWAVLNGYQRRLHAKRLRKSGSQVLRFVTRLRVFAKALRRRTR